MSFNPTFVLELTILISWIDSYVGLLYLLFHPIMNHFLSAMSHNYIFHCLEILCNRCPMFWNTALKFYDCTNNLTLASTIWNGAETSPTFRPSTTRATSEGRSFILKRDVRTFSDELTIKPWLFFRVFVIRKICCSILKGKFSSFYIIVYRVKSLFSCIYRSH